MIGFRVLKNNKDFKEKAKGDIAYKLKEAKLYIREHKDPQPIKHVVQKDDKKPAAPAATPPATPTAPAAPPAAQTPPPTKK